MAITAAQLNVILTSKGTDRVVGDLRSVDKSIKTTGAGFDDLYDQSKGFDAVSDRIRGVGSVLDELSAGMTVIGSAMAYAGNAAMNQERQMLALERSYGDAADTLADFAEEIQRTTQYSDEAARESARIFSSLVREYGLSIDQVQQLMVTSADLASLAGVGLQEASQAVQSAIRGETEHAEMLGLALNQTAIDTENLTLTMSNAEAAAFRFDALMDQAAYATGAAGDMAQTSAGQWQSLQNRMQDAAVSAGEFIGPLGSMVGGLGMAVTGVGGLAGAFGKLGTATRWLVASPAGLAITGLVAGVGALGVALRDSGDDAEAAEAAYQRLQDSILALDDAVSQAKLSGDFSLARDLEAMNLTVESGLQDVTQTFDDWLGELGVAFEGDHSAMVTGLTSFLDTNLGQAALDWAQENRGQFGDIPDAVWNEIMSGTEEAVGRHSGVIRTVMEGYYESFAPSDADKAQINAEVADIFDLMGNQLVDQERLMSDFNEIWAEFGQTNDVDQLITDLQALEDQTVANLDAMNALVEADYLRFRGDIALADHIDQMGQLQSRLMDVNAVLTQGEQQAYAEGWKTINEAIREGDVDASRVIGTLRNLEYQLASGQITDEQFARSVVEVSLSLDDYAVSADGATRSTDAFGESMAGAVTAAGQLVPILHDLNQVTASGALDILNAGLTEMIGNFEDAGAGATGLIEGINDKARADFEELQQRAGEFIDGMFELAGIDVAAQVNLAGLGTDATRAAQEINQVGSALDSVLAIYGQIDAMGNRMSEAGGIVDALFGPDGDPSDGVGPLRDVFDAGLIGQEQFNAAIEDGIQIQQAAADSQLYLNKMRADQLPILNDTTQAYLDQIKAISEMSAQEQMVALGWMDSGMQGRAQQFTEMISLMNNFGAEGEAAMQQVIDGIVATDPVLTAMLDDLGLIEQQLDGSYTLSLDAEGAVSDLERVNTTLGHLIDVMRGDELGTYGAQFDVKVTGVEDVEATKALIDAMDDHEVSISFAVSGQEQARQALRNALGDVGGGEGGGVTIPLNLQVPTDLPPLPQPDPIEVPVVFYSDVQGAASNAAGAVGGILSGALGAFGGGSDGGQAVTISVNLQDNATAGLLDIGSTLGGLDAASALVIVNGNNGNALAAIDQTRMALNDINGQSSLIEVLGENGDALAAIGEIQAYNGVVLATSYHDIVTRQIGSTAAGFQTGAGFLAGFDQAMDINSPSGEMDKRGVYMFQGLGQGWNRESDNLPIGFDVASPAYAGYGVTGSQAAGSGGTYIAPNAISVTVQAETNADADMIAVKVVDALETAVVQRRAGFGGVKA